MNEMLSDLAKAIFFLACMAAMVFFLWLVANGFVDKSILHAAIERVGLK